MEAEAVTPLPEPGATVAIEGVVLGVNDAEVDAYRSVRVALPDGQNVETNVRNLVAPRAKNKAQQPQQNKAEEGAA